MSFKKLSILILFIGFCLTIIYVLESRNSVNAEDNPPGSYKRTCNNISYNEANDLLEARCRDMNSNLHTTTMRGVKRCLENNGDISNCNGELKCTGEGLPPGSYQRSCWCCYVTMDASYKYRLTCYCNPKKGQSRLTSLQDAFGCYNSGKDIANCNGTLKCGGC